MSDEWVETVDKASGKTYYYNKVTKETSWKKPKTGGDSGSKKDKTKKKKQKQKSEDHSGDEADPNDIPENWAQSEDPASGRSYYYNKVTKKTSWKKPACLGEDKEKDKKKKEKKKDSDSEADEDAGEWVETKDPSSGKSYWYNTVTKKTTWKNPNKGDKDDKGKSSSKKQEAPKFQAPARKQLDSDDEDDEGDEEEEEEEEEDVRPSGRGSGGAKKSFADDDDDDDDEDVDQDDDDEDERPAKGGRGADPRKRLQAAGSDDDDDLGDGSDDGHGDDDDEKGSGGSDDDDDEGGLELDDDDEASGHTYRFAKHRKGWFNRVFRVGAIHDDAALLTYKKSLIKKALLKQNRDLDAEAIQAFKNVMSYMGDRNSGKKPIEHAKKLLRNLMVAPAGLRDEVYMQLCKQTTQNPRISSTIKGWELMSYCLATFPPSKHLKGFLIDYIKKTISNAMDDKVRDLAELCAQRVPKIVQMGQRKQVPSRMELECLKEMKPVPIRVYLVDKSFKTFYVDPYTLVSEVEEQLIEKFNLSVTSPFALYEAAESNVERILDAKDRVLDVQAAWENLLMLQNEHKEAKAKAKGKKFVESSDAVALLSQRNYNSFLFKAKLVLKTSNQELMSDPEAINLVYLQAVNDVTSSRYPYVEKDLTVLAALQLQATFSDYKKDVHVPGWLVPKIESYVPRLLLEKKGKKNDKLKKEWEQKVLSKYAKVAGFTALEAKLNYLDYVQEWPFYGATFFVVEQRQFQDYPSPLTVSINCEGVMLMHPTKQTQLENWSFTDIVTWGHSDEKFIVVIGNIVQQRKLIFKTDDGKHINHLIHDYVRHLLSSNK